MLIDISAQSCSLHHRRQPRCSITCRKIHRVCDRFYLRFFFFTWVLWPCQGRTWSRILYRTILRSSSFIWLDWCVFKESPFFRDQFIRVGYVVVKFKPLYTRMQVNSWPRVKILNGITEGRCFPAGESVPPPSRAVCDTLWFIRTTVLHVFLLVSFG